jgi:hypothetical protein
MVLVVLLLLLNGIMARDIKNIQAKQIYLLDELQLPLTQKIKKAGDQFSRERQGDYFLTGYSFRACSRARVSGTYIDSHAEPVSRIYHEGDRLVIRHFGYCTETDDRTGPEAVDRDIIMLHKRKGSGFKIVDVSLLNPDSTYRLTDIALYWLGRINTVESKGFLVSVFKSKPGARIRKGILAAVALHHHTGSVDFLYSVVQDHGYTENLRKNAVFWMGMARHPRGLIYLKKIAARETDYPIRKQVVFAFYLNGSSEAVRQLIGMARADASVSIRKKAIFWLGQKASKESIQALKQVIESEDELTVKSSAVFAISQLPRTKAVPMLIDIARKHRSPNIRKKAIFWLGEIGDERAIDFFEDILLK